jgi:hypothetical protein
MPEKNAVIAIYPSHSQAEEALKELQRSGFDMKKLSIVGRDLPQRRTRRRVLQRRRPHEAVG